MWERPLDRFLKYIKTRICKQMWIAFVAACAMGGLAHFVAMSNILNNYDSITQLPAGVGTGASSGRWLLSLLEMLQVKVWYDYNIPFFNLFVGIFVIAVSAGLIVKRLSIENHVHAFLVGSIMVVFPPVTSMFFFTYTVPHYALAIFMVVVSTYLCDCRWYGYAASVILLACSLGIYQAYFPIAAGILVLSLINDIFEKKHENIWPFMKKCVRYLSVLVLGVVLYLILNKVALQKMNVQLSNYRGINSMGKLQLSQIPTLIKKIMINTFSLASENYCGISSTVVVQKSFSILGIVIVIDLLLLLFDKKVHWLFKSLAVALVLMMPIAADLIEIMSVDGYVYTLMVYGMFTLLLLPIVLDEKMWNILHELSEKGAYLAKISSVICSLSLFLMVANYIWSSNVNYTFLYYTNEQTREYLSTMATRMRSVDGYSAGMKVAFIGTTVNDEDFTAGWGKQPVTYGGTDSNLLNYYSRNDFMSALVGYRYSVVSNEIIEELEKLDEVKKMNTYPDDQSIKIVNDILVVKLGT